MILFSKCSLGLVTSTRGKRNDWQKQTSSKKSLPSLFSLFLLSLPYAACSFSVSIRLFMLIHHENFVERLLNIYVDVFQCAYEISWCPTTTSIYCVIVVHLNRMFPKRILNQAQIITITITIIIITTTTIGTNHRWSSLRRQQRRAPCIRRCPTSISLINSRRLAKAKILASIHGCGFSLSVAERQLFNETIFPTNFHRRSLRLERQCRRISLLIIVLITMWPFLEWHVFDKINEIFPPSFYSFDKFSGFSCSCSFSLHFHSMYFCRMNFTTPECHCFCLYI